MTTHHAHAHPQPSGSRRVVPLAEVEMPHECSHTVRMYVLGRADYFAGLDAEVLDDISQRMHTEYWDADDLIYRAGEPARSLYVVAEGRVKLTHSTPSGVETVMDILAPGEMFGTLETLGEPNFRYTASALVGSCTLRIDQTEFRDLLAEQPRIGLRVLDDVVGRLHRTQDDLTGQGIETVAQRVAVALLRLADKLGDDRGDAGVLLEVPLSRADLAGLSRSTPESVSRVMSRWKKDGVIDSGRRWTALLDRPRLEAEATGNG